MQALPVLPNLCCGPATPALAPDEREALAARFKALADPARVAIVNRLAAADEVCVCDLNATLDLAQPTVSHHLRVLREAGLIEIASKRGTFTFYRLVPEAMQQLAFAIGGSPAPEGVLVTRDRAVAW